MYSSGQGQGQSTARPAQRQGAGPPPLAGAGGCDLYRQACTAHVLCAAAMGGHRRDEIGLEGGGSAAWTFRQAERLAASRQLVFWGGRGRVCTPVVTCVRARTRGHASCYVQGRAAQRGDSRAACQQRSGLAGGQMGGSNMLVVCERGVSNRRGSNGGPNATEGGIRVGTQRPAGTKAHAATGGGLVRRRPPCSKGAPHTLPQAGPI